MGPPTKVPRIRDPCESWQALLPFAGVRQLVAFLYVQGEMLPAAKTSFPIKPMPKVWPTPGSGDRNGIDILFWQSLVLGSKVAGVRKRTTAPSRAKPSYRFPSGPRTATVGVCGMGLPDSTGSPITGQQPSALLVPSAAA